MYILKVLYSSPSHSISFVIFMSAIARKYLLSVSQTPERIERIKFIRSKDEKGIHIHTNKQCIQHTLSIPKGTKSINFITQLPEGCDDVGALIGVNLINFPEISTPITWAKNDDTLCTMATLSINTEKGVLEHKIHNLGDYWYNLLIAYDLVHQYVILYGEHRH